MPSWVYDEMNKSLIAFFSILTLSFSQTLISANAMENGFDAPLDGRTVPIINYYNNGKNSMPVCTGFLYSDRIVLTAGHCLFDNPYKKKYESISIGYPDEPYSLNSQRVKVQASFASPKWGWADDVNFNPTGEFGIYVLSQPIKVKGKVEIASSEKLQKYIDSKALVTNVGYGKQTPQDSFDGLPFRAAKLAQWPLVSYETVKLSIDGALKWSGKQRYNMSFHVLQVPGGPSSCSGDSGSPFYIKEDDTYVYLGPASNGLGGAPNCSGKPWEDSKMYVGAVAAYDYLDLIAEAEKFVADNPYVEPKVTNSSSNKKATINCIKGKTTKKVTAINPKCPVGYKKK